MTKLEKLLYRKKIAESAMSRLGKGAEVYSGYCDLLRKELERNGISELTRLDLEKGLMEAEFTARNFITSFKETKREYVDYIIPELEEEADEETKKTVEFIDAEKEAEKLAKYELYGKTTKEPDNVEHQTLIADFKKNITLYENLISEYEKALPDLEGLPRASAEKKIFDYNLAVVNLKKRLNQRVEYYHEQFLPKYRADMKEADRLFPLYMKRAKEMVKLGVDPKLHVMLQEHDKHKEDKETEWLFYTSLKTRVDKIAKFMRKNPAKYKGNMKLAEKIR